MKIPVILLNYNSSDDCRKCVSFLKRQQGIGLEIIIVDNCSREDDCIEVKKLCQEQGCTFIQASENRGYNAGNNIGLRYAGEKDYEYALIANPDMEFPQEDYVSRLVAAMKQNKEIVVCGSDIVDIDNHHQNPMFKDAFSHDINGLIKTIYKQKTTDTTGSVEDYKNNHYCTKVSGCCLLLRMDFIKQIGYFDENIFLYCEEAILSRQVEIARKKMYYMAEIQAIHSHISSMKGNPIRRFESWRTSRIYFIDKYSGYNIVKKMIAKLLVRLYVLAYKLYNVKK